MTKLLRTIGLSKGDQRQREVRLRLIPLKLFSSNSPNPMATTARDVQIVSDEASSAKPFVGKYGDSVNNKNQNYNENNKDRALQF